MNEKAGERLTAEKCNEALPQTEQFDLGGYDMFKIAVFFVGLIIMLGLMLKTKVGPLVSMLFGALIIGMGCGLGSTGTIDAITSGFGSTCKSIGIVIIFGTILGEYLEKSNASQRIATTLLRLTGTDKADFALTWTGYLVSIPVFCDVALIMLSPICKSVAKNAKRVVCPLAVALALGLLNTNAFVIPTPAPLSVAVILELDLGKAIFYGLIVAFVASMASWAYAHFFLAKKPDDWFVKSATADVSQYAESTREIREDEMPGFTQAILPILVPILLIVGNTTCKAILPKGSPILDITSFIGNSNIALAFGAVVAVLLLYKYLPKNEVFEAITNAMQVSGPVIFITAAGGALARVLDTTGIGKMFADMLSASGLPVILIPFLIAGLSKFAQGSGNVAAVMSATLSAPLCIAGLIHPVVAFLAICAGSQFGSHVNNSFFWVFANLFEYDTKTTLKTLAVGQHVNAISGLLAAYVIGLFL